MSVIYAADLFCYSCGESIRHDIIMGGSQPDDMDDESSFDSDEFPKFFDDSSEIDCPQHCGSGKDCLEYETLTDGTRIGCLIGTNLTECGIEYVREAIRDGGLVSDYWAIMFADSL